MNGASPSFSKSALTPSFYQEDTAAGFENGGENYCAPTAVADGLGYLAAATKLTDLVPGVGHDGQVDLIKQLAAQMNTDPSQGTDPGGIIDGVFGYVETRNHQVDRMEVEGWRGIGSHNKSYAIARQPDLAWLRAAARDPRTVVLMNVGWYRAEPDGYSRQGGHWVDVVGAGPGGLDFELRNPAIAVDDQPARTAVTLQLLDDSFTVSSPPSGHPGNMAGYYKVAGPGLPHDEAKYTAVIDGAMLFTVKN